MTRWIGTKTDIHKLNKNGSATTTVEGDVFNAISNMSIPYEKI